MVDENIDYDTEGKLKKWEFVDNNKNLASCEVRTEYLGLITNCICQNCMFFHTQIEFLFLRET